AQRKNLRLLGSPERRDSPIGRNANQFSLVAGSGINRSIGRGRNGPERRLLERRLPANRRPELKRAIGAERKSGQAAFQKLAEPADLPRRAAGRPATDT